MLVIVDRCADRRVVLDPFSLRDLAVFVLVSKVGEKLLLDVFFGHLSGLHLGVHRGVLGAFDVVHCDGSVAIFVELQESFVHDPLPLFVQRASEPHQKFIEI